MKILITYYSRTGTTKKIAENLQSKLNCDIEEIIDLKDRSGAMGYLFAGKEAAQKISANIKTPEKNIEDYDLVIVGTPIWAWNISCAIRAYILQNKEKFKQISAFCTMSGDGDRQSFEEIEKLSEKKLVSKLALKTSEVTQNKFQEKIDSYCATINN